MFLIVFCLQNLLFCGSNLSLLVNRANTNPVVIGRKLNVLCTFNLRPVSTGKCQVKINCSKFIIDTLQQQCHVTFLIYLFVTSRNLLFGVFLTRAIITIVRKTTLNFRQVSLKNVLLSVSVLKCFGKIL